jgi:hypothetical protein
MLNALCMLYTLTIGNNFKNFILPWLGVAVVQELASGAENLSYSFVTSYLVILLHNEQLFISLPGLHISRIVHF